MARNEGGRKRIIGCALHADQQTLVMLDSSMGEVLTRMLLHEGNQVREFYAEPSRPPSGIYLISFSYSRSTCYARRSRSHFHCHAIPRVAEFPFTWQARISLRVVSEARVRKLHTRARWVCALSVRRLERSRWCLRQMWANGYGNCPSRVAGNGHTAILLAVAPVAHALLPARNRLQERADRHSYCCLSYCGAVSTFTWAVRSPTKTKQEFGSEM
jgi:hypothetical protein